LQYYFLFSILDLPGWSVVLVSFDNSCTYYVSEISSTKIGDAVVALYQFNIVLGILIAFTSNYFLQDVVKMHGDGCWGYKRISFNVLIWNSNEARWLRVQYKR
jgi:hypothetical protein